jgi:hypothetical protein
MARRMGKNRFRMGFDCFINKWMQQLRGSVPLKIEGKVDGKITGADLAAAYSACAPDLQSETLRRVTDYPFRENMASCDAPNPTSVSFRPSLSLRIRATAT